jgi:L-malate glycosyltransferase
MNATIVHVIPSLDVGGTERQLVEFIRRSSSPTSHLVACFDGLGPLAERLSDRAVLVGPVVRGPSAFAPSVLRTVTQLRRLIRDTRPSVVHAHLGAAEAVAALATPRGVPLVASRRGMNVGFEGPVLRLVEGLAHRRVEAMVCNSRFLAETMKEHDRWPPPGTVIHNGVDATYFAPHPLPTTPIVTLVANAHHYKRHDRFLSAFRLVLDSIPEASAFIVGRMQPDVQRYANRLGLSDAVRSVGGVADVRPFIERCQCVVLASDHEGFPNALLEAMSMGRPVVATAVGGVPELVRDGIDGLLVPTDADALAKAMIRMLREDDLRDSMAIEARRRAEQFGWERVVRETEAVYATVQRAG